MGNPLETHGIPWKKTSHVATASSGIVANSLSEVVEENQLNFHDQQFPWLHFSVEKQRILFLLLFCVQRQYAAVDKQCGSSLYYRRVYKLEESSGAFSPARGVSLPFPSCASFFLHSQDLWTFNLLHSVSNNRKNAADCLKIIATSMLSWN